MSEGERFTVQSGPYLRRLFVILPVIALVIIMISFLWYLKPDDPFLRILAPIVILVYPAEVAILHINRVIAYEVREGRLWSHSLLWRREVRLPTGSQTMIVPHEMMGSKAFWIASRERFIGFQVVANQDRFISKVSELIGEAAEIQLPQHACYRGFCWFNAGIAALLFGMPLAMFAPLLFRFPERWTHVLLLITVFVSPFLLISLFFMLLALNVRVTRDGTELAQRNMFGRVVQRWDIDAPTSYSGFVLRRDIIHPHGRFRIPFFFGFDKRLVYDVFAIARGNSRFE